MDSRPGNHLDPCLVLMAGYPGSGKSTLARAIGQALDWTVIDKDVIVTSLLLGSIAEDTAQPASYGVMFALGLDLLRSQRRSVILDSPAGLPVSVEQATRIASEGEAVLICILCLADRDTRNHRVANRIALGSQPVRESQTHGDTGDKYGHLPDGSLLVDTTRPLDDCVRISLAHIARVTSGGPR